MTEASLPGGPSRTRRHPAFAVVLLGVALSAFFDGILLHQVLQWHHLLSLAEGATWRDLHNQILADGLSHLLVYAVMAVGFALLWRGRGGLQAPGAGRRVLADLLIGFGLWNFIDIIGFHWLAGIHRVRVDVPEPLPWDLGWLAVLGAVPLLAGIWLRRRPSGGGNGGRAAVAASAAVLLAGAGAMAPTAGGSTSLVVFRPGISPNQAFAAALAAGAKVADISPSGRSMIVTLPDEGARWRLYSTGALVVGGGALAGCGTAA